MFPLIPLPNKEATFSAVSENGSSVVFPLIPLPNKEATEVELEQLQVLRQAGFCFH